MNGYICTVACTVKSEKELSVFTMLKDVFSGILITLMLYGESGISAEIILLII